MQLKRELGLLTAILIIIADVIGTGIFMTTGKVLGITSSAPVVLVLWILGALVAVTGALCYAELSAMWPHDGGEYIYLKKIYGLMPSFLTGWISLVVGFTTSAAISSILVIWYINEIFKGTFLSVLWIQKLLASCIVIFFGIIHIRGVKKGGYFQNVLTIIKLLLVFSLIVLGFSFADWNLTERLTAAYGPAEGKSLFRYGSALLIIMYAYSGWNGAAYIAGEIKDPEKNLPRAMFLATLSIGIIYFLLNIVFLISTPGAELMGKEPVGAIAAKNLFGESISPIFTVGIALILLSSVSVQTMVGPRVYYAMANDKMIFQSLKRINPKYNTPDLAIIIQIIITVFYIFIGMDNVISLLIYMGFSLGIFPLMAVMGLIILRYKEPHINRPYKVPFFPLVPVIYIILTAGMMITSLVTSFKTSLTTLLVVVAGIVVFFFWNRTVLKDR